MGDFEGTGTAAALNGPWGLAVVDSTAMFATETNGNRVRRLSMPEAVSSTLAGSNSSEYGDSNAAGKRTF